MVCARTSPPPPVLFLHACTHTCAQLFAHAGHVKGIIGPLTWQYTNICFPLQTLNYVSAHLLLASNHKSQRRTNIQHTWRAPSLFNVAGHREVARAYIQISINYSELHFSSRACWFIFKKTRLQDFSRKELHSLNVFFFLKRLKVAPVLPPAVTNKRSPVIRWNEIAFLYLLHHPASKFPIEIMLRALQIKMKTPASTSLHAYFMPSDCRTVFLHLYIFLLPSGRRRLRLSGSIKVCCMKKKNHVFEREWKALKKPHEILNTFLSFHLGSGQTYGGSTTRPRYLLDSTVNRKPEKCEDQRSGGKKLLMTERVWNREFIVQSVTHYSHYIWMILVDAGHWGCLKGASLRAECKPCTQIASD